MGTYNNFRMTLETDNRFFTILHKKSINLSALTIIIIY